MQERVVALSGHRHDSRMLQRLFWDTGSLTKGSPELTRKRAMQTNLHLGQVQAALPLSAPAQFLVRSPRGRPMQEAVALPGSSLAGKTSDIPAIIAQ